MISAANIMLALASGLSFHIGLTLAGTGTTALKIDDSKHDGTEESRIFWLKPLLSQGGA